MRKKLLLILIVSIVAVSVVVAGILLHCDREPSTPSTPTILSMTDGNIFVMKAGTDSWIEAQAGMSLESGDTIKTGDGSSTEITFFDGSTIKLEAGTQIEVVSLGIFDTGSTTIRLKQTIGDTISRVTNLVDSASRYEVETLAGVAAVRGSVMLVNVIEDGTTLVTNQEGNIWGTANGVELQIPEGRQCIIIPGQPPQLVESSDVVRGGSK
jgi:ferric-dicitrate binding protein FerR (iron transport regulator)